MSAYVSSSARCYVGAACPSPSESGAFREGGCGSATLVMLMLAIHCSVLEW